MEKELLKQRLADKELELKRVTEAGDAIIREIEEQWEFQRHKNIIDREDIQDEIDELRELIDNMEDNAPTEILTASAKPAAFSADAVAIDSPKPAVQKPVGMFGRFKQTEDSDEGDGSDSDDSDGDNDDEELEFL